MPTLTLGSSRSLSLTRTAASHPLNTYVSARPSLGARLVMPNSTFLNENRKFTGEKKKNKKNKIHLYTEDLLRFSFPCWERRETEQCAKTLRRLPWCRNKSTFNLIDRMPFSSEEGTNWRQRSSHCKRKVRNSHQRRTKAAPCPGWTISPLLGEITFLSLLQNKSGNLKYFETIRSLIMYRPRN